MVVLTWLCLFFVCGCTDWLSVQPKILRVGTSGDYLPFSYRDGNNDWQGFDIELALRFAADHNMKVRFVTFQWPDLLAELEADKFDVAMSGVTVRPDRSLVGHYTVPLVWSGAVVLVEAVNPARRIEEVDLPSINMGVNAGGHLERVTREHFSQAQIITSQDNQALPGMFLRGEVDALVTDTLESPGWLEKLPDARALPPFTRDLKAWLIQADKEDLAHAMNAWLLEREADGTLAQLRRSHLPAGNDSMTAAPLPALLAAINERLSLMPAVAESKRRLQKPVEDLEQERRVLDATVQGVTEEAKRLGVSPPPEATVRTFFQAQMEAAKAIQTRVLAGPATLTDPPDLVRDLRPALQRINGKIILLLVLLHQSGISNDTELIPLLHDALQGLGVPDEREAALARSIMPF